MNNFVTVKELAEHLNCNVIGDKEKRIYSISLMQDSTEDSVTYVPSSKIGNINEMKAGVIITKASIGLPLHRTYIITRHRTEFKQNGFRNKRRIRNGWRELYKDTSGGQKSY